MIHRIRLPCGNIIYLCINPYNYVDPNYFELYKNKYLNITKDNFNIM